MESRSGTVNLVEVESEIFKRRSSLPVKLQRQEKIQLDDNEVAEATRTPSASKTAQTARLACEGQPSLKRGASLDTIAGIPELDADELSLTGDGEDVDIKLEMAEDGSCRVETVGESQEAKAEGEATIPKDTLNELPESNEDFRELLLAEIAADADDELGASDEDGKKAEVADGGENELPGPPKEAAVETETLIIVTEATVEKAEVTSGANNDLAATAQGDSVTPTLAEASPATTLPIEASESAIQLPNGDVLYLGDDQNISTLPGNLDRSKKGCCRFKLKCCRFRRGHSVEPMDVLDEECNQNPLASDVTEDPKVAIIEGDDTISPVVNVSSEEDKIEVVNDEETGLEMEKAQADQAKKPGVLKRFGKYLKKQWQMSEAAGSELDYLMKKSDTKSTYLSVPPTPTPSLATEGEVETVAVTEMKQEFEEKPENDENPKGEVEAEELKGGKVSPLVTEIGSSKGTVHFSTQTGLNAKSAKSLQFGSRSWRTLRLGRGENGTADEYNRCHSATPALRYLEDAQTRRIPPPVKPRRRMKSAPQARLPFD